MDYLYLVADTNEQKDEYQNPVPRMSFPQQPVDPTPQAGSPLRPGDRARCSGQRRFDWVAPSTLSIVARQSLSSLMVSALSPLSRDEGEPVLWKSAELPVWDKMTTFYAPKLVVQATAW